MSANRFTAFVFPLKHNEVSNRPHLNRGAIPRIYPKFFVGSAMARKASVFIDTQQSRSSNPVGVRPFRVRLSLRARRRRALPQCTFANRIHAGTFRYGTGIWDS